MTLIHMQSEKGRVAMMRSMETRASSRAQQPGPSGSAAHRRQALVQEIRQRGHCTVITAIRTASEVGEFYLVSFD